eukprot:3937874-Rhodomonas_salina.3
MLSAWSEPVCGDEHIALDTVADHTLVDHNTVEEVGGTAEAAALHALAERGRVQLDAVALLEGHDAIVARVRQPRATVEAHGLSVVDRTHQDLAQKIVAKADAVPDGELPRGRCDGDASDLAIASTVAGQDLDPENADAELCVLMQVLLVLAPQLSHQPLYEYRSKHSSRVGR